MTETLLRFQLDRDEASETLSVTGELDIASAAALERTVAGVVDGQGGEFRLDISAMTFMDSTGAQALLHIHHRVESLGRQLVIVSPTRPVRRVLEIMGLDRVIKVEG
jgi:anti-sigma B factor antagonist